LRLGVCVCVCFLSVWTNPSLLVALWSVFVCEEEPCFVSLLRKQTEEEGDLRRRRIETVCVCVCVCMCFFGGFGWMLRIIDDDDDVVFWVTEAFG
jgi:hypothetical protein